MSIFRLLLFAFAVVMLPAEIVRAGAVISIDMDPLTPGIQNTLTVTQGDMFSIEVLIGDDGQTPSPVTFDTLLLELSYNNAGAVLGPGSAGFIGGDLAGNSPFAIDLFGTPPPVLSSTGGPLTAGPSSPVLGYANGSGAVGLFDPTLFILTPGSTLSVLSYEFAALAAGNSTILPAGSPPGSPVLALGGQPVAAQLLSGSVTVERNVSAVPEPHSATLMIIGSACIGAIQFRRRRKHSRINPAQTSR